MNKVVTKKKAVAKGVTAWSFSRLGTYEQCPRKFKLTVLDGMKEPGSLAMDRGSEIHKQGEQYLKGRGELPDTYKLLAQEMTAARTNGAESELEVTFTKAWSFTGWFDADAWLRIKIDILVRHADGSVAIVDIKTGKNRGGYEDQLELYALAAMLMYPEATKIAAELWFVDSGEVIGTSHGDYTQADVPELKAKWEKRVLPMFVDDIWAPTANQWCRWCHVGKETGCDYAAK